MEESPPLRSLGRVGTRIRGVALLKTGILGVKASGRTLATAGWDGTVLVWGYAAAVGLGGTAHPLSATELEAAWSDLAGRDAARAYKAIGALAGSGDKSIPFLRERLQPTSVKDHEAMRRWVADLDSDDFDAREKATRLSGRERRAGGRQSGRAGKN